MGLWFENQFVPVVDLKSGIKWVLRGGAVDLVSNEMGSGYPC